MVSGFFEASWAYMKRRGKVLSMTLIASVTILPYKMWAAIGDHRDGVGYFSDPLGKPSLLGYWSSLLEFTASGIFVLQKRPTGTALAAMKDAGDGVTVIDRGDYFEFAPPGQQQSSAAADRPLVGVVLLPGAFVPPTAYAPLARSLANTGHASYIVHFDLGLAFNGWEKIGQILPSSATCTAAGGGDNDDGQAENCLPKESTPTKWVLVGHSMGAVAIEKFFKENPASVDGVVYMGSGNNIGDALAGAEVPGLLLRGSRDPFCLPEDMKKSTHKLPKDTDTVVVEGGNHRGFAQYTRQPLDWEATISLDEQQKIVHDALTDFIDRRVAAPAK